MITNGWKATAFAVFSLTALAALAGGVRARDDKTTAPGRETTNSLAAGAPVPPSPARVAGTGTPPIPGAVSHTNAGEPWPLTLAEAVRIGLDNSEAVRVVAFGAERPPTGGVAPARLRAMEKDGHSRPAPMVIMPQNPRATVWRFKSQVMAMLRAVEQQYWNLAQAHAIVSSAEQAVRTAHEIHGREQAELTAGRGKVAYVAEAAQRLEQFNLDLVTRTSDVITTERLLRKALGLPPADNRRIIPCTPPTEARLEPDWDTSLAVMKEQHPDIASIKSAIADLSPVVKQGSADRQIEALNSDLQQTIHQKTHSLARFFLEIDANYKQFKTASRLRAAAVQRLDAQRAYYEEGRIAIDRFLDSVSQYATAVATEFQYKTTYNVSICALEEAKGTLLAYDNIAVVDEVKRSGTSRMNENRDMTSQAAGFEAPAEGVAARMPAALAAPPPVAALAPEKTQTDGASSKPTAAGKTAPRVWSFSFSIGRDRPFLIKGTIAEGAGEGPDATGP